MQLSFPLRSVFLALPLEQQAKWQFQALQEALRPWEDILSFQNPQSPHLTLQFWKEVMQIEWDRIVPQAETVAAKAKQFSFPIIGAQTFGHRGEDTVLFLEVAFSEELARLRKSCPWPSDKPFAPHITLARIRHPQRFNVEKKRIFKELENIHIDVPCSLLRLYAEIDGRKQTPLMDFPFGGTSP